MNQVSGFPNDILSEGDLEKSLNALKEFNLKNANAFIFGKNDVKDRQKFTTYLLDMLESSKEKNEVTEACLEALVVMSRDNSSMTGKFVSRETWNMLTGFAEESSLSRDVITHACKCVCNIIFLTKDSKGFCNDDTFLQGLIDRLNGCDAATPSDDLEFEFLTLRFLFLVTVLNAEARTKFTDDYGGRRLLLDYLTLKLNAATTVTHPTPFIRRELSPNQAKSCSEILKTLFNVNIKAHNEETQVREERITLEFKDITSACRRCFLIRVKDDKMMTDKLHSDAGNCMYSVPSSCFFDELFVPPVTDEKGENDSFAYDGSDIPTMEQRDMSVVSNIIDIVDNKIMNNQISTENLQPILSLLSHLSRSSRYIRKFCKKRVIPPRKDFEHRPEVGQEFRNKFIKLFTNANTDVKGAAADFVFVLCKEKVDRLVKYTGYGNAAGLLASRGLLAGGRGDTIYSDTDSDSDTEEYLENVDRINPITGHIPPELPNPMEGMTDEQKEYIAVQLANQISKLSEGEVFQPVCVDEKTGKLVPFQQKVHETELPEEKDSDDSD